MYIFKNILYFLLSSPLFLSLFINGYITAIEFSSIKDLLNINNKNVTFNDFQQLRYLIDTNEITLVSPQKPDFKRRNIFKDIKSSLKYRNDTEKAIEQAKKAIAEAKSVPKGYSIQLIKQAEENLISAEIALKSQKYFESTSRADKSFEFAYESMPFRYCHPRPNEDIGISYNRYIKNGNEIMAEITCKNIKTNIGFTKNVKEGEIISGELSNPQNIDIPDGKFITVKKFEFQIEDILPNKIFLKNITTKGPIFSISMPDKPKLK